MPAPALTPDVDDAQLLADEARRLGAEILALLDEAQRDDPELFLDLLALIGVTARTP